MCLPLNEGFAPPIKYLKLCQTLLYHYLLLPKTHNNLFIKYLTKNISTLGLHLISTFSSI